METTVGARLHHERTGHWFKRRRLKRIKDGGHCVLASQPCLRQHQLPALLLEKSQ